MSKCKVISVKVVREVTKERLPRSTNIATRAIPWDRTDTVAVYAIFHKSFRGSVLVALNANYKPVNAWRDIECFIPIKSKLIRREHFENVIQLLKPKKLYLNDGQDIAGVLKNQPIHVYSTQTLTHILSEIQDLNVKTEESYTELSYAEMKSLDPTLTRREYNKLTIANKRK